MSIVPNTFRGLTERQLTIGHKVNIKRVEATTEAARRLDKRSTDLKPHITCLIFGRMRKLDTRRRDGENNENMTPQRQIHGRMRKLDTSRLDGKNIENMAP
ncbi:hypothetical protein J6590_060501 [Homalodisca vitripennis]|nr:hypothetical protein J6590_060501 [Homalodisca vitripennis]